MADPVDIFTRAVNQTGRIVHGVQEDQFGGGTPCSDWTVRDLLNHIVIGAQQFDAAIRGDGFDLAAYGKDAIGDDPFGVWERAAAALTTALSRPGVLDQDWVMPGGPTPGEVAVDIGIIEFQQHGWDLARATGQSPGYDADVAAAALAAAQDMLGQSGRPPGTFGDEVDCPEAAPVEDRVAAFLGRQP